MSHYKLWTILLLLVYPLCIADAQVNMSELNTSHIFSNPTSKDKTGIYKSQKIKGKISGRGAYLFRNGSLYFGDFIEKKFNGNGTIISIDSIPNCPECTIFVGKFKNGIKNGIGRCYNNDGELIYYGKFVNDIPINQYPMSDFSDMELPYFTLLKGDNYTIVGEYIGDAVSGLSLLIYDSGDIYISTFENGRPEGLGVYIQSNGEWYSEKNSNGTTFPISSSELYTKLSKQANENFRQSLSVSLGYFAESLQSGSQFITQTNQLNSIKGTLNSNYPSTERSSDKDTSIKSTQNSSKRFNLSEQQNYNLDKSTYHKYDGLLSKAFSGNTRASITEMKDWQEKMKQIRLKWEKRGKSFPHFPNEDKEIVLD